MYLPEKELENTGFTKPSTNEKDKEKQNLTSFNLTTVSFELTSKVITKGLGT